MLENYIATYFLDAVALTFLCYLISNDSILDKDRKGPFYLGTTLTILIILSDVGTIIAGNGSTDLRILNIICNVVGFTLAPVIPIILIAIFDVEVLQSNKLLMLPSILNMFATALSPWFNIVFYVDTNNKYTRGNYFFIFMATYIINLMIMLICTVKTEEKHHYQIKTSMTILSLFVIVGTSIQIILPTVYSAWHSVTLSLLLYYLFLTDFDGSLDALTKLHNRAAYEKMINKMENMKSYSVIVIDVNNFKEINDTYGHDFGDNALKKIASVIRKSFDNRCICYRVGGDEFYIINSETDPVKLEHQLKSMTVNLEKERKKDEHVPTVAYGYSIFKGGKAISFQEVLKEADERMYVYKSMQKDNPKSD